ncbi:tigger transposable element-derived protein [Elysia marginata]|uniref:Tigger transposable element-derived protein n=1 Tax=Elysia marginata TaxID=1093978 RepID=A0AAV4HCH8_9GAST|nr:tigger transposable element-derived protein [Elysia marginata]
MDGSDKLPALVIGKAKNPRAFKRTKTLPVCYSSNKKAWMTSALFEEWLKKLDRQMVTQEREIAMVVYNCPAHPKVEDLKAIELIFLPPNTTRILQPCDQGIIKSLKHIYRKLMVRSYLLHVEEQIKGRRKDEVYTVNILDALYRIKEAWSNGFKRLVIKTQENFNTSIKCYARH